jgi:hypothetical protein
MRAVLAVSLSLCILAAAAPTEGQSASSPPSPQVTFTRDVAPILQQNCQVCHRPDTFAPMSLMTYEQVRPWARAVKAQVMARTMPPWFIERHVGIQDYIGNRALTDEQIATIARWVDEGAVQGDLADLPLPRTFPARDQWNFGEYGAPDLVLSMPEDYIMPGSGSDHWPIIRLDPKLTEDRYIAAIQMMATKGYRSLHHAQSALLPPTTEGTLVSHEAGEFLNEYAIGKGADVFGANAARLMKAGSQVSVELHLHPAYGGEETPVNVALGIKFHPKGYKPKHDAVSKKVPYGAIDIRPGEPNGRVDGYLHLPAPTRLLSWQPHMHNRGKAACIVAILPSSTGVSSRAETLSCAGFNSNWHLNYVYTDESAPLLPAGTVLQTIQWYDNSAANKNNTDPDAQLTHGQRTIDEMGGAWISYYHMSEEEYKQELAARGARNVHTSADQ